MRNFPLGCPPHPTLPSLSSSPFFFSPLFKPLPPYSPSFPRSSTPSPATPPRPPCSYLPTPKSCVSRNQVATRAEEKTGVGSKVGADCSTSGETHSSSGGQYVFLPTNEYLFLPAKKYFFSPLIKFQARPLLLQMVNTYSFPPIKCHNSTIQIF